MTFLTDFFTSTQMTALLAAIAVFFTTIILVIKQWVGFAFSSILLLISIIIAGLIHQPQFFNRAEPFAFVEKNQEQFAELQKEVILLKEVSANFFKEVQLKIEKVNKKTLIVIGGYLAASSNTILRKTLADLCVVGNGEIPWVGILKYMQEHLEKKRNNIDFEKLSNIKGLAFIQDKDLVFTGYGET